MRARAFLLVATLCASPDALAVLPAYAGINWNLTAAEVAEVCNQQLDEARARIGAITTRMGSAASGALLAEIEDATADLNDALIGPSNLSQLAVSREVRDAATHCSEEHSAFGVAIDNDPTIYSIAKGALAEATQAAPRRLATLYVEAGRRAGAGLDPAARAEAREHFEALSHLEIEFHRALSEDRSTIEIDPHEASSLTSAFIRTLTAGPGGYRVAVNEATVSQFMANEDVPAARRRFYLAYFRRGGEANVERLAEAAELRDRLAHLLGFTSWAAYRLEDRMAKTPQGVLQFLAHVDAGLLPKAKKEVAVLAALKSASGDKSPFERWDYSYWEHQLEKSHYAFDRDTVRRYFPVSKVVPAVFGFFQNLLGVRIDPVTPALAWAPGVEEYSISDAASGAPLGWFYLDLFPREGKFQHFSMFGLRAARTLRDGTTRLPVSAIVGNWPVGEVGRPALLSHQEVISFVHEFGHLMHHTLAQTPYQTTSGIHVRGDFVEAPAQMLENFMWQPGVLRQLSSDVQTGEPIPEELVQKMIAAKHVADGVVYSFQAFLGTYDMRINSTGPKVQPTRLWFELTPRLTPFQPVPGTIPEASFGYLMGASNASYYSSLWSLAYSQDLFSAFQKEGASPAAVGVRLRTEILQPGGLAEPDELVQHFLGRAMSSASLYQSLGVAAH